jgi:hypothetical protein
MTMSPTHDGAITSSERIPIPFISRPGKPQGSGIFQRHSECRYTSQRHIPERLASAGG